MLHSLGLALIYGLAISVWLRTCQLDETFAATRVLCDASECKEMQELQGTARNLRELQV